MTIYRFEAKAYREITVEADDEYEARDLIADGHASVFFGDWQEEDSGPELTETDGEGN